MYRWNPIPLSVSKWMRSLIILSLASVGALRLADDAGIVSEKWAPFLHMTVLVPLSHLKQSAECVPANERAQLCLASLRRSIQEQRSVIDEDNQRLEFTERSHKRLISEGFTAAGPECRAKANELLALKEKLRLDTQLLEKMTRPAGELAQLVSGAKENNHRSDSRDSPGNVETAEAIINEMRLLTRINANEGFDAKPTR